MKTFLTIAVAVFLISGLYFLFRSESPNAMVECATPVEIVRLQAYNVDTVEFDDGECTIGFYSDDVFYEWKADVNGVTIR